jgi:predicted transcriptional regulator
MQAAAIKRKALFQNPQLRMSANNVRDVMKYLLKVGVVRKVNIKRRGHPRYELTDLGEVFKELLLGVRVF